VVPGYEIVRELGRGGMGVVYQARHLKLNRFVALKMILAGSHAGAAARDRFQTEAEAIARLQHPNIVQVHEVGEHEGKPYFALEFCGGGNLANKLGGTPLPARNAAALVETLARAMQAAHEQHVIHRDLKPANVLLADDGTLKITDFGLAKKLDEANQTQSGAIMGTPWYMAPEQAVGKSDKTGQASDVYALGAILYECLTGRPPFKAATALETIQQVVSDEPVRPSQLQTKVPRDLETICLKCLHKEPSRRYATARDLAEDLRRFLKGEPIVARPVGQLERTAKWIKRNPVVTTLLTAIVVSLVVGATVGYVNYRDAREQERIARTEAGAAMVQKGLADQSANAAREQARIAKENEDRAEREKKDALHQLRRSEWSGYASKLSLAQAAYAEGNVPEAHRHLDECQWDLRGWEHRHLRSRFDSSKQTLRGHKSWVTSVSFSPDGKRILTGSNDHTAKVWDADKGTELLTLDRHTGEVSSVSFSPDGKRILTGSWEQDGQGLGRRNGHRTAHTQGTHRRSDQRGLQPRRQTHSHRKLGHYGKGLGRGEGHQTAHPYRTRRRSEQRELQPRRPAHSHRKLGQDGQGLGCGQGHQTTHPQGTHQPCDQRELQPRRQTHSHRKL
jgi:hypothetical protein